MKSKKRKAPLDENQQKQLARLHFAQTGLEISLVSFLVSILTINISTAFPAYGIVAFLVILLSGLAIFVFGIQISVIIFGYKGEREPLPALSRTPKGWIIATWVSLVLIIALLVFNSPFEGDNFNTGRFGLIVFSIIILVISCFGTTVSTHLLWKRFNKRKGVSPRIFVYGFAGLALLLIALLGSYSTSESIPFEKTSSSDNNLELGQSEVRQAGRDGRKDIKRNLLFGFEISSSQIEPVNEVTAKGTRKYQYMHCSDGSYRYYTNEQFQDPNTGFTHQSPDYCAENGSGAKIAVSDTPPAQKIIQQVPVYNSSPSYHSTTCTPNYLGNSFTCRGYY